MKVFSGASVVPLGTAPALLRSFYAYAPTFTGGVFVAAGDTNGDGLADIVTGRGSGDARTKVFSGAPVPLGVLPAVLHVFDAFQPTHNGLNANSLIWLSGARVAAVDVTGDGLADIVAAPGPAQPPMIHTFDPTQTVKLTSAADLLDILFTDPSAVTFKPAYGFLAEDSTFLRGLYVGG